MQGGWKKVFVFVSSTFNDMHGERDFLVKRVFPRLSDWCERRRLRLVDIDLRWGVTEEDATLNRNVVNVCMRRIDECRPFFLCFLGQRYGWIPNAEDVSPETTHNFPELDSALRRNVSVTELEIQHAVISPLGSANRDVPPICDAAFFFLREDGSVADLPADPGCLRRLYDDKYEPDGARRDFLLGRISRLKQQIEAVAPQPPIRYRAHWDAGAITPELELPLECPAVLEGGVQRWRQQWCEFAGLDVAEGNLAVPPGDRVRAIEFNRRLTAGRMVGFSSNGERLEDLICDRLQHAIQARHPENVEGRQDDALQLELDRQEQFLFDCSQEFIARGSDFNALDKYLAGHGSEPLVVTAPAGAGKSMLLAAWLNLHKGAEKSYLGLTFHSRFIGASQGSSNVASLLSSIATELARAGKYEPAIPASPSELRAALPAILEAAGQKGLTVIVLDGINQLESGLRDLDWLPRQLPKNVRLIVSLRSDLPGSAEILERWRASGRMLFHEVPPFQLPEHRRMLVNAYLSQYLKQLDDRHIDALITAQGSENPLFLKVVLSELRVFGGFAGLWERIRNAFGQTPESAFRAMLRRLETEAAFTPISAATAAPNVFGLLAHARSGLSIDELAEMLSDLDPAATADQGRETALHYVRQARQFLARREGRYDFFYESLRIAARDHSEERRSAAEWHRRLAGRFRKDATDSKAWRTSARRALAELPYHLMQAGDLAELSEVYSDMSYMDARCRSLGADAAGAADSPAVVEFLYELQQAIPALMQHDGTTGEAVNAIFRLLSERSALLSRFPGSAVQEIGNYLDRYSGSDRAQAIQASARRMQGRLSVARSVNPETFHGHSSKITAMAASPSGKEFLTGAADGTIGYWSVVEDRPRWLISAHEERVNSIAFSPDGRRALSAGYDGGIQLWDLALSSHRLFRPVGPHAFDAWVGGFVDAETALAATAGVVFRLDLAGGSILWSETVHPPEGLADLPEVDRKKAEKQAAEGRDVLLYIATELSYAPSSDLRSIVYAKTKHRGPHSVHFLPSPGDEPVKIAELALPARLVLFAQNHNSILVADHQGYTTAYDRHGAVLGQTRQDSVISHWCLAEDGSVIAADRQGGIHRIELPSVAATQVCEPEVCNYSEATALAPMPGGRLLAGNEDGSFVLIELAAHRISKRWGAAMDMVAAAFQDRDKALAIAGTRWQGEYALGRGPYVLCADGRMAAPAAEPHSNFLTGVAVVGKTGILTVDRGGVAAVWQGSKPKRVHRIGLDLTCCCSWDEGGLGVAGTAMDVVCLIGEGPVVRRMPLPPRFDPPGVSAVAARGRPVQIIAALHNSEVAATGRHEWRSKSRSGMGTAAALDATCRRAATGHGFGKIHLWDVETGEEVWQMPLHIGPVFALAFGPDGLLYSTGADHRVLATDPENQQIVAATELAGSGIALLPGREGTLSALDSNGTMYLFAPGGSSAVGVRRPAGWRSLLRRLWV